MAEEVSHVGRIVEITPEFTTVEIVSESACSSCHAKGLCSLGESKTKAIQLPTRGWDNYKVGDEVNLTLSATMGHKAVWIAYVIPLAIMMGVLLAMVAFGAGELAAGLCAIGAVAVYYLCIKLFGKGLKNEYIFNIKQ